MWMVGFDSGFGLAKMRQIHGVSSHRATVCFKQLRFVTQCGRQASLLLKKPAEMSVTRN
jgi:hypothetical protein